MSDTIEPLPSVRSDHAEVYSKPDCPFCLKAKALLDKHQIAYTEISAVDHRDALIARVTAATGNAPRTVPQIFLNGEHVGGHDDLVALLGRLYPVVTGTVPKA